MILLVSFLLANKTSRIGYIRPGHDFKGKNGLALKVKPCAFQAKCYLGHLDGLCGRMAAAFKPGC
jgi:hypothetical protein